MFNSRISSFHNYQSVQNDMRRQEMKVFHNQAQLASGKKLLSPSDSPLATHYIQNVSQQQEQLKQYVDSIVLVRNRLEHQEVLISNAEEYADDAKRTVMEMINGALSDEDREARRRELEEMSNNLMSLANSQDELGNFIFAGTKPANQPFFRDKEGNVTYSGDDYQRKMRISNTIEMPFNNPGSKVFMDIDNPYGDYEPDYKLQPASELLLEKATNTDPDDTSKYSVQFVDMGDGSYGYQLSQDGSVVKTDVFNPHDGIQYNGLKILLRGQITPGDQIELSPKKTFNIFEAFKGAAEYSRYSVSDSSASAKLQQMTAEFEAAFIHLNKVHTDLGARMETLDTQEQEHEDFKISLAKSKSQFEDLDYAEAVIDFNENTRALQASQKAFGKAKDLTLFNYI